MNVASYQKFMSYEATRLVPLFHLKLSLSPTVWKITESVMTVMENFSAWFKEHLLLEGKIAPDAA